MVPVAMAHEGFAALGTAPENKSLVVIEGAEHLLPFERSDEFSQAAIEFVEKYR